MSLNTIFQISSQGMTAQRERLEAASANLANAETTRAAGGGPYRRRDVVFEAVSVDSPKPSFESSLFSADDNSAGVEGVSVKTIAQSTVGEKRYEPGHPDADPNGFVTLPDVNPLEEMVNIMSAARAFEANATAFNTAKEMARTSLKLSEA